MIVLCGFHVFAGFVVTASPRATNHARPAYAGAMRITAVALVLLASAIVAPCASAQSGGDLTGKTVLVTGSTDGLGREVALRVARLGAHVIVHGRNLERGKAVVGEIEKLGKGGAERVIEIKLTPDEQAALQKSAAAVKELTNVIGV